MDVYIYVYIYPIANHFNKPNHAANDFRCCILIGHSKSNKERQPCEQKLIVKYNPHKHWLDRDKSFLSNYRTYSYILLIIA